MFIALQTIIENGRYVCRFVGSIPSVASHPALAAYKPEEVLRPTDPEYAPGFEASFSDGFPILLASEVRSEQNLISHLSTLP